MKKFLLLSLALITTLLTGCANYRLAGTAVDLPFSSVYVEPVQNVALAPQAAPILTNAISKEILQVPDLRLAYKNDAQASLSTRIVDYEREAVATSRNDTALAASYRITIKAECTLVCSNGTVVFKDRPISASSIVYVGDLNLIENEYQAMPAIMKELATKIKDAVIGIW